LEFRQGGEPNTRAIFDDGPAGAVKIDVDVFALMHPELTGLEDYDAVLDSCNMGWARD